MKEAAISECLAILRAMPHGREQEWTDALRPLYIMAIKPMQDKEGKDACGWAALNEEWRPSPARLRQIASRLASPYPDSELAYSELIEKAQTIGLYGKPIPGRPNCFTEGPPDMSHPIVGEIVAYCGGWEMICSGEAQMQEGLKKQIRTAHEAAASRWERDVTAQLCLPTADRDLRFFPPYKEYRPMLIGEVRQLEQREPLAIEDEAVRSAVRGLAAGMTIP